jgi:hypothetical protein
MTVHSVTNKVYTPPAPMTPAPSTPDSLKTAQRKPSPPSVNTYSSSRYSAPLRSAPATKTTFSRFGSSTYCPGCHQSVSPMERGVVPGPQGTRWHGSCLICGGREARGRNGRRRDGRPGCGKQLDSSAKYDAEEKGVWCRECLVSRYFVRTSSLSRVANVYLISCSSPAPRAPRNFRRLAP